MTDLTLTVTRLIAAPPDRVFAAWLDPGLLARFMTPGPGMTVPEVTTDPRTGGRFHLVMADGDRHIPHAGTYLAVDPNRHLAFTWESPFSTDGSRVSIDFAPEGAGTFVKLTHVIFANENARAAHEGGWTGILNALAAVAFSHG